MSVDKFGRHSAARRPRLLRGPKGEGFTLTKKGNYDIGFKRLVNVGKPTQAFDAVSMDVLKDNCLTHDGKLYDAKAKIIRNVGPPLTVFDVVTWGFLQQNTPRPHNDSWVCNNKRLSGVKRPINADDAVTKSYLEDHTPTSEIEAWDCKKKRLHKVADPRSLSDAVNVEYFGSRLGLAIHTMYSRLATDNNDEVFKQSKDEWIRKHVYETFFGGPIVRSLAIKDVEPK